MQKEEEKELLQNGKKYKIDGFYYDKESRIAHVFEFNRCYFHGWSKSYSRTEICKETMK